jgi:HSP20 family protein
MATENSKDIEVRRNTPASTQAMDVLPEFERVFDNMVERFFGPRFNSLLGDWPGVNKRAVTNIQEDEKCYVLTAEIPGIPKEDVDINISGNLLTVRAESQQESGAESSGPGFRRQYRSFQQSFALPTTVDADKIEANYENGVLEIMLPKVEQAQAKKIEIQSNKGSFLNRLLGKGGQKASNQAQAKDIKH